MPQALHSGEESVQFVVRMSPAASTAVSFPHVMRRVHALYWDNALSALIDAGAGA